MRPLNLAEEREKRRALPGKGNVLLLLVFSGKVGALVAPGRTAPAVHGAGDVGGRLVVLGADTHMLLCLADGALPYIKSLAAIRTGLHRLPRSPVIEQIPFCSFYHRSWQTSPLSLSEEQTSRRTPYNNFQEESPMQHEAPDPPVIMCRDREEAEPGSFQGIKPCYLRRYGIKCKMSEDIDHEHGHADPDRR
jgi:hypothetical protein